ncbi:N-acetylneuraminate synthase family protein [Flavobacteriaceae bacterium]|nr:N-acetylneuraminate synthase family protein [Flavobacteriaceae bacterium]
MIKVIAEIGWNHCGDMGIAKKMILASKKSGATFAKFQTWSTKRLKHGEWDHDGRREIYEKAQLTKENHIMLKDFCESNNIEFLSSAFSIPDAELLVEINCKSVKIPSFESRNHELIRYCNKNFDTIIMSCGTSTFDEVKESVELIDIADLYLMHCVSVYPGEYKSANLPKMKSLMKLTKKVGLSDHIEGVESAKIAIGEGAVIIEKHFTIDKDLPGRDNKFAIMPEDLDNLTTFITNRNLMLEDKGLGYNNMEEGTRLNYTGRFNG